MTPQQRSAAAKKAFRSRKRQDEALARPVDPVPARPKSKAARITDLLATTDLTREQVADRVGCLPAYVRTVEQRLVGNCAAKRWKERNPEFVREYEKTRNVYRAERRRQRRLVDPEFCERERAQARAYQQRKREARLNAV